MNLHRARILAMQAVFQREFQNIEPEDLAEFLWIDYQIPEEEQEFAMNLVKGVLKNTENIDERIGKFLINWKMERINPVNRAILRVSVYQLMTDAETSWKYIINEGVKLARKYSDTESVRFINGILDSIARDIKNQK